jgi:hypothetical protein
MGRPEYDADASEADCGFALQRSVPAMCDLAQQALAAEAASDDHGMIRWHGQVTEQEHVDIGTVIANGNEESLASQIRPLDDRFIR